MDIISVGKALGDKSRRTALALVEAHGPLPVGVLARHVGVTSATMSHHVAHLQRAGLTVTRRKGRTTYVSAAWKWLEVVGVRR
jgi:DNA-binding transcriptional ArsR family regulator